MRSNPDCETVVSGRRKEMSDRSVLMVEKSSSSSSVVVFPRIRRCPMMLAMEESSWMMMDDVVVVIVSDNDVTRIRSNFIMMKLPTDWILFANYAQCGYKEKRSSSLLIVPTTRRHWFEYGIACRPREGSFLFSALLHDRFSPASHWRARPAC